MNTMHPIQTIVEAQKQGKPAGIYSCCSSNSYVLKTALEKGKLHNTLVLIESTANQVDQYGGYSGMKPADFKKFIDRLVIEIGIDPSLVVLGGDHLGPLTFANLPEKKAMAEASELIRQYVLAGFTKIHLDTSMRLADDAPSEKLSDETIARRGAQLCRVAEEAFQQLRIQQPNAQAPVYVIGSEVPIPGGAQEEEESISVTSPEACRHTIEAFRKAFSDEKLNSAWERVVGIIVQPGVEFGDAQVAAYCREKAADLMSVIEAYPGLVFEGHSTDYQTKYALREMVEDGIAVLKVGPALTFALREALLSLEMIEKELLNGQNVWMSDIRNVLETTMLEHPEHWIKHYHGSGTAQRFARTFSYSDRVRYCLNYPAVSSSIERLMRNLKTTPMPLTVISQYMPIQYTAVLEGRLSNDPEALLMDRIGNCIDEYLFAIGVL